MSMEINQQNLLQGESGRIEDDKSSAFCSNLLSVVVAVCALFLLQLPLSLLGQDISGKLVGQVTDTSGAAVANATITATNLTTSFTRSTQSDSSGDYAFESLPAGVYTVTCNAPGYAKILSSNDVVEARQTVTLPIKMTVAGTTEQVEVSGSSTTLDVTTAQVQNTLPSEQLGALPIEGRDPRNTIELTQPGVVQTASGNTGTRVRVNGGRGSSNNYQIDGTENIDYFNGNASPFPPVEDLAEFSLITNSPEAQYGTSSGSQVSAIVKSGTAQLHGMAWTYIQNSGLNANSWAGKRAGDARPTGSQHWYGFNVGGPVFIPKMYDGRQHTFFFFSYEYTNPTKQVLQQQRVLTNAERAGDFSGSSFGIPVIDGTSTPQLNISDYSNMAKALLANTSLLPTTSDPSGIYDWYGNSSETTKNIVVKIDKIFSDKHRLFVTFFRYHDDHLENPMLDIQYGYPMLPNGGTTNFLTHLQNWTINDTYSITPRLMNNFILGIRPYVVGPIRSEVNNDLTWSNVGVPGIVPDKNVSNTEVGIFVNSYYFSSSTGEGFGIYGNYNDQTNLRQYNIADNLIWELKRHTIRAGYYERVLHFGKEQDWAGAGIIDFLATNNGSTGNPFADFLLGKGAAIRQQSTLDLKLHYPAREFYVQDEWKVTPNLTATYGVRWAPNFGITETRGELSAFRPGVQSTIFPYAPVGLVVPGDQGIPASTYPTNWTNVDPRVSLAWDVTGKSKLVIHLGYGINSDYLYAEGFNNIGSAVPYGYTYQPVGPIDLNNVYDGSSPFPYNKPIPGTSSTLTYQFPSTPNLYTSSPNFNSGKIHQYNAGVQWEPFAGWLLSASLVGTRGTHLAASVDLNAPYVSTTATSDSLNVQSRRPYQQFQDIYETFSGANSWYNSLQTTLNKHFSHNFSILASYTLSRNTDSGDAEGSFFSSGNFRDPHNIKRDYGISTYDLPQIFTLLYDWHLGDFNSAQMLVRQIVGGWTWSGNIRAIAGDALTITSSNTFNYSATNSAWANYVSGSVYGNHKTRNDQAATWLNKAAFCPANEFGTGCSIVDSTAGLTHVDIGDYVRGSARGPGKFFADMTVTKHFPLSEHIGSLDIGLSAFNVFNHTVLKDPDTSIADGTFGEITSAYDNRSMQLTAHWVF